MLGHPVFRAKIREWLKVLRKANCAVVLATQSLSDAARSGILDVLIESCPDQDFLAERRGATRRHRRSIPGRAISTRRWASTKRRSRSSGLQRRSGITTSCRQKAGGCSISVSVRSRFPSPASARKEQIAHLIASQHARGRAVAVRLAR